MFSIVENCGCIPMRRRVFKSAPAASPKKSQKKKWNPFAPKDKEPVDATKAKQTDKCGSFTRRKSESSLANGDVMKEHDASTMSEVELSEDGGDEREMNHVSHQGYRPQYRVPPPPRPAPPQSRGRPNVHSSNSDSKRQNHVAPARSHVATTGEASADEWPAESSISGDRRCFSMESLSDFTPRAERSDSISSPARDGTDSMSSMSVAGRMSPRVAAPVSHNLTIPVGTSTDESRSDGETPRNRLPRDDMPHNELPHNELPRNELPHNDMPSDETPRSDRPRQQLAVDSSGRHEQRARSKSPAHNMYQMVKRPEERYRRESNAHSSVTARVHDFESRLEELRRGSTTDSLAPTTTRQVSKPVAHPVLVPHASGSPVRHNRKPAARVEASPSRGEEQPVFMEPRRTATEECSSDVERDTIRKSSARNIATVPNLIHLETLRSLPPPPRPPGKPSRGANKSKGTKQQASGDVGPIRSCDVNPKYLGGQPSREGLSLGRVVDPQRRQGEGHVAVRERVSNFERLASTGSDDGESTGGGGGGGGAPTILTGRSYDSMRQRGRSSDTRRAYKVND